MYQEETISEELTCEQPITAETQPPRSFHPEEISAHQLVHALVHRKRLIFTSAVSAAAICTALALLIPPEYSAESVILTPEQSQSSLSAMAQLAGAGSGAGLAGLGLLAGLGFRNPTDLYVGILESRTIADALITKFDLRHVYATKDFYGARKRLARNTTIRAGRDTLIHIRVQDRDPKRAGELANGYVDELAHQNATVALTEASQRRLFFEKQLEKEKDALANAEVGMRQTQQTTGLVAPTGQADALVRALSQLHQEILSRQAQVEAMRTYVAETNPRFQALRRELAVLQDELAKLEQGKHVPGSPELAAGELPEVGLEFLRKYREVKYHETLFEILSKQYEAARLDEAKSAPVIQVIDKAVTPERKSWPPRTVIVIMGTLAAALASSFSVIWGSTRSTHQRILPGAES